MPWADTGLGSLSGFGQQGFLLLVLYIYPVYKILKGDEYNKIIGVILGTIVSIFSILFAFGNTIDLFWENVNVTGAGLYVFICASIGFTAGNVLYDGTIKKEELSKDFDEVKSYVRKASSKIGSEINKVKENKSSGDIKEENSTFNEDDDSNIY